MILLFLTTTKITIFIVKKIRIKIITIIIIIVMMRILFSHFGKSIANIANKHDKFPNIATGKCSD